MPSVPGKRVTNYGSAPNFSVYTCDANGKPGTLIKAPVQRSLGSRTDTLLVTSGHRAPYSRHPYNGGDFYKTTAEGLYLPGSMSFIVPQNRNWQGRYNVGLSFPIAPDTSNPTGILSFGSIRSLMIPMGSKGWNRFRPGKPVASLSQFIGELRQLPKNPFRLAAATVKSMRSTSSKARRVDELRRAVGDQYLNYSFGWRPFLQDLEKIADFDHNLVQAMRQLRRDHGETVRREGTIESDSTSSSGPLITGVAPSYLEVPYTAGGGISGSPNFSTKQVTSTVRWRCWFSAGFVYHLPREDDPNSMDRLRTYLKGGGISPSVVWELTPWSWLADYFTNIGDVLENWEASRELALAAKYCYVMYHKESISTSVHQATITGQWGQWSGSASYTSRIEMKARTWASPYGFGFTSGNLSNGQMANLTALGLSRRI